MVSLPQTFSKRITNVFGVQGAEWLQRLPSVMADVKRRWSIKVGPPFPDLSYNYVAPVVTEDGTDAVLKLAVPSDDLAREAEALRVFRGEGTVILLKGDPEGGALLLERAVPGSPLSLIRDDEEATAIGAQVMRALWRPVSAGHPFPSIGDWADGFRRLRLRFGGGTGPYRLTLCKKQKTSLPG